MRLFNIKSLNLVLFCLFMYSLGYAGSINLSTEELSQPSSNEAMNQCQQDYKLYLINTHLLRDKKIQTKELYHLYLELSKSFVGSAEYCEKLSAFNAEIKKILESQSIR